MRTVSFILAVLLVVSLVGICVIFLDNSKNNIVGMQVRIISPPHPPHSNLSPLSPYLPLLTRVSPASCRVPKDGMIINQNTVLCQGVYNLPNGIRISERDSDIVLDCNGSTLIGYDAEFFTAQMYNNTFNHSDFVLAHSFSGIFVSGDNNFQRKVIIKNCKIENYFYGIELAGATNKMFSPNNIAIQFNEISNCQHGINSFQKADSIIISDNFIHNNFVTGISTQWSNISILKNEIKDNKKFFNARAFSGEHWYYYATCPGSGIFMFIGENNLVKDNKIEHMCEHGLYSYNLENSIIFNNLFNDTVSAVFFGESDNIKIIRNNIFDSKYFAIKLLNSNNTILTENNIETLGHHYSQDSFTWDDSGHNNQWFTTVGNHYVNMNCPDVNMDNICDVPRNIFGSSNSVDLYPLKYPV